MFTRKRLCIATGVIILIILLFLTTILPGIISDRAKQWVSEETGRSLEIGAISINPFSLSVEIRELRLSEKDHEQTFLSWNRLRASVSISSVYHRAPVIDLLQLDNPKVNLERLDENTFNFSDMIPESNAAEPSETGGEPARFSVNNIAITGGEIDLVDASLDEPKHHTIRDLQLVLPSIGNLPYMVENPAQPLFHAMINDAPFDLEGHMKPFTTTQEMQFELVLDNIDLPHYLGYVPVELPVELRNGKLNLDLDLLYRISEQHGSELLLSGDIGLAALDIWDRQAEKLFFLPLLQVKIAPSRLLQQQVHLDAVRIYNLEVQLNRDSRGDWNHVRMAQQQAPSPESSAEPEEESSAFQLEIDTIEVHDGVVFFEDLLPAGGFETVAREININVKDFSLSATDPSPVSLFLKTDRDETIAVNGHILTSPLSIVLETDIKAIQLGAYEPYYRDYYKKPFAGTLDVAASLTIDPEHAFLLEEGRIDLHTFRAEFNDNEGVGIEQFSIDALTFDLDENRMTVGSVNSSAAKINFSRDKLGEWSFMSRNFPILAKLAETTDQDPAPTEEPGGPAFSYRIDEVKIDNWALEITDQQPATTAVIEIDDLALHIRDLAAPDKVMSPFDFGMTLQRKGRIELTGATALADQESRVKARLAKIPLTTIAPYVAEHVNLVLKDGALNARLHADVTRDGEVLQITYGGDLGVNHFSLLDGLHREDLLKWGGLQFTGIEGQVDPMILAIDSITLDDYFAKVLIDEEARLNLVEAFRSGEPETEAAGDEQAEEVDTPEESADETSAPPRISIETVTLQGGQVDFTDRNLPRTFHADMQQLGGRIKGLSSEPDARADVDLRGQLRNQSPLQISGVINPLAEQLALDLKLSFDDIELSPLSPYSGTYVGYLIEKGKLHLALEYTIEEEQLIANNQVFIDQFTFGEAVESDQATSLPVKLAVALLKDRNGEIHLDIPVTGSLDDPEFSIGGVIWTVVKNLLIKAATSPLALLGALAGGGDADFSSITFAYGSSALPEPEQDKLRKMAGALLDRPSLEIEVKGFIDPDNDPEGLRQLLLRNAVKEAKYRVLLDDKELPEGMTPDAITVADEEYPDYLWQVYKEAPFPKPRNFVGITKKIPVAEQEKLFYAHTEAGPEEMSKLARDRAVVVQQFLVTEGKMPKERVFLTAPDIEAEPAQSGSSRSRVEFGITVR